MPEIRPFRGLRYDTAAVSLADVVAPPYDVISEEYQRRLYERNPYNVVRLILGRSADRYREAAACLQQWKSGKILRRDERPAVYVLRQDFTGTDSRVRTRTGFIAACRVEEFGEGGVLPHEKTLSKPKEDRFRLLQATNTNFSQVFSLFQDSSGEVDGILETTTRFPPEMAVEFEQVTHRIWKVESGTHIDRLARIMKDVTVLIADGHHRYETALAYRDMMRIRHPHCSGAEAFNFTMMYFTSMNSDGLLIYPTHRLVHGLDQERRDQFLMTLREAFVIEEKRSLDQLAAELLRRGQHAYGLILGDGFHLVILRRPEVIQHLPGSVAPPEVRDLDVSILHSVILEQMLGISQEAQEKKLNLEYVKNAEEAEQAVRSGRAQLAFLMNPTRVEQVRRVARAGLTMPQKSTYFHPKLPTGLVMNPLED
jgi:uncharacterized protein (DUF1015 family)